MALNDGKPENFLRLKNIVKAMYKLIYWLKKSVPISFPQDFLRVPYKCGSATSALASFHFLWMSFFLSKLFIVCKRHFSRLSARLQTRVLSGMSLIPFYVAIAIFVPGRKKKKQEIFCSRMWACIFRVKWCTLRMHNAMARIGLKTNSSGDVSLGKEEAPLLKWIC